MGTLLSRINEHIKAPVPMGECAAISKCQNHAGKRFYIASLYLWPGQPKPRAADVADWFKTLGCVGVSVSAVLHEEDNGIAYGEDKHGVLPWEVTFTVPDALIVHLGLG